MRKKAIYIIGGGYLGLNVVRWAKEVGLYTIVTDKNFNAPGFDIADESIIVDGTDTDAHKEIVKSISQEKDKDIVGVYCNFEQGIKTAQTILKTLGKEHLSEEAINASLNKDIMKKIWKKYNISTPKFYIVKTERDLLCALSSFDSKIIVKPCKGSGSIDVRFFDKEKDNLDLIISYCSDLLRKGKKIIIEEFIEGRLIDVNGVFIKDNFYPCGVLEKYTSPFPYCLPLGGYDPANINDDKKNEVYKLFEKACKVLGLTYGPVKGDLIMDKSGKFYLLEVFPRFHGDVTTSNNIPFGTGINPIKFYFKYIESGRIEKKLIEPKKNYATWRVICLPPGKVRYIRRKKNTANIKNITKVWFNSKIGNTIGMYTNTTQIPGYICSWGHSREEAEESLELFFNSLEISIDADKRYLQWYNELGNYLEKCGFSRRSCGFIDFYSN